MFRRKIKRLSCEISAQDLVKEMDTSGKSAFLRLQYTSGEKEVWKHCFVVLISNTIYIYEHEHSDKPMEYIPLFGYNRIARNVSVEKDWSFSLTPSVKSLKVLTFSCTSDRHREEWMLAFKQQMYKAYDVETPKTDNVYQPSTNIEQTYVQIEHEPIGKPEKIRPLPPEEEYAPYEIPSGLDPVNASILTTTTGSVEKSYYSPKSSCLLRSSITRRTRLPIPSPFLPENYENVTKSCNRPSDKTSPSLLDSCLITDPTLERDHQACISLLQRKSRLGTYLVRKSNKDESLMLSVLTDNSRVRDYLLEGKNNRYRLPGRDEFVTIEDLLLNYSHMICLPGLNHFLTEGIFESEEQEVYMDIKD